MKLLRNIYLRRSIFFIAVAILFSWPIFFVVDAWIFPNLMQDGESVKALFFLLGGHVLGMFGPAIATLIISKFVIKSKLPVWHWSKFKYYLYGFIFMSLIWLLPAALGFIFSSFKFQTSLKTFQLIYMITYIGTAWFASMGEEIGWSSFLLSYLVPQIGKTRAVIISGTYRGIWHFPILISPILYKVIIGEQSVLIILLLSIVFMIQLIISNILFGSFFAYLWFKTKSTPLLGWLHFIFDLTRDFSMFFIIGFSNSILGNFGWAILFYLAAYYCLEMIMRNEGIKNIFKFVYSKEFRGFWK